MQPDHEADDLQALLDKEYGAPRLDDRFSEDLIGRLQAEATPTLTPMRTRTSPSTLSQRAATVAVLVIGVVVFSNLGAPGPIREADDREGTSTAPIASSLAMATTR